MTTPTVRGGSAALPLPLSERPTTADSTSIAGVYQNWAAQYARLVETFVEPERDGASLRAANFVPVGRTAGRGRQDRRNRRAAGVKSIYMYELQPDWRRRLGVQRVEHAPRLEPGEGLASASWAGHEFGGASTPTPHHSTQALRLSSRSCSSAVGSLTLHPVMVLSCAYVRLRSFHRCKFSHT